MWRGEEKEKKQEFNEHLSWNKFQKQRLLMHFLFCLKKQRRQQQK